MRARSCGGRCSRRGSGRPGARARAPRSARRRSSAGAFWKIEPASVQWTRSGERRIGGNCAAPCRRCRRPSTRGRCGRPTGPGSRSRRRGSRSAADRSSAAAGAGERQRGQERGGGGENCEAAYAFRLGRGWRAQVGIRLRVDTSPAGQGEPADGRHGGTSMKATKAYIASLGTTGVLLAASLLMLAVVSAVVAFDRWPTGNVSARVQTLVLTTSRRRSASARAHPALRAPLRVDSRRGRRRSPRRAPCAPAAAGRPAHRRRRARPRRRPPRRCPQCRRRCRRRCSPSEPTGAADHRPDLEPVDRRPTRSPTEPSR